MKSLTQDPVALSRGIETISGTASRVIEKVILREFAIRKGVEIPDDTAGGFAAAVMEMRARAKSRR